MKYIKLLLTISIMIPILGFAQGYSIQSLQKINNDKGGLLGSPLGDQDRFGYAVEVIGDVDKDGIDDIAVGAILDDDSVTDQGAVYILMLNADGSVKNQQKISALAGNGPSFNASHVWFGSGIAALGDLNGDGNVDIAVGGYGCGDDGDIYKNGAVYILFLSDSGTVLEYNKISDNQGGGSNMLGPYDYFGSCVENIGDINGDGLPDLAVGATSDDDGGSNRGAVYILNLDYNGRAKSYQKISDTYGGFTGVLDNDDNFGTGITALGDLDGDGVIDIAVGAIGDDDGGAGRGAVWICFMNADGTVKSHQKISDTQGSFTGTLDDTDYFGQRLVNLGDLDSDGISDIGVAADRDDDGGTDQGALWILYLKADGTVKSHDKIGTDDPLLDPEVGGFDYLMCDVAFFGDRNNDGKIDLVAGAWQGKEGAITSGEIYILHLEGSATYPNKQYHTTPQYVTASVKHSAASGEPLYNDVGAGDHYGKSVCGIGDIDGDGVSDMVVGAQLSLKDGSSARRGAVYIHLLNADGSTKSYQKVTYQEGGFAGTLNNYGAFGASVCSLGDLDGDGVTDIAVGSPQNDDGGGFNKGAVWILFLTDSGTVKSHQRISATQGNFNGTLDDSDYFGKSLTSPGDIDGDGVQDLAVAAYLDDDGGTNKGAIWILFLNTDGTVKSEQKISDLEGNFTATIDVNDFIGYSLTSMGDLDGNGTPDICTGAIRDDDGASDGGAAYILFLSDSGTVISYKKITEGMSGFDVQVYNFDYIGNSMDGGNDFDQDGINDLLLGSRLTDDGGTDRGAVYMLLLNSDGSVKSHKIISSTSNKLMGLIKDNDWFASSIATIDHNTQNNTAKIAIGAYVDDDGATNAGAVYVVEVKTYIDLSANYFVVPENPNGLGSIELTPKDGTAPYIYFWDDGDQSKNRYNLESDVYYVTVFDTLLDSLSLTIPVGMEMQWAGINGVTTDNDVLQKTAADGWSNGTASVDNIADGEGEIMATIDEVGKEWTFGYRLTTNAQANQYTDLDYGYYVDGTNTLYSWENTTLTELGMVAKGDVVSIEKTSTEILFKKNETVLRQIDYDSQNSYRIDFSLFTSGMKFSKVMAIKFPYWPKILVSTTMVHNPCFIPSIGSIDLEVIGGLSPYTYAWSGPNSYTASTQDITGLEPGDYSVIITGSNGVPTPRTFSIGYQVSWTDVEGALANGNSIQKTDVDGYGNSGGASNNTLAALAPGWAEFTINDNTVDELLFGLSFENPNELITSIEYGIRLYHWQFSTKATVPYYIITENGIDVTSWLGTFNNGDKFSIKRDNSGIITYYKNNVPVYTSVVTSNSSLIVDVSMDKINSTVLNANVSFGCAPISNIDIYTKVFKELDDGYYLANNDKIFLEYTEDYTLDPATNLKYIMRKEFDLSPIGGTVESLNVGNNRREINFLSNPPPGFYILEIENSKKEKRFLRFKIE